MSNRRLSESELVLANVLLDEIRQPLDQVSGDDEQLLWAFRRKVYKELTYDERGTPMHRRRLKERKRIEQGGKCADCGKPLPKSHVVLDRLQAMEGYTLENTRLIHQECDVKVQRSRGFA